jgi:A/G-specific adenine glycosylase
VLREAEDSVPRAAVEAVWDDAAQRERALASLIDDGLIVDAGEGSLRLPG